MTISTITESIAIALTMKPILGMDEITAYGFFKQYKEMLDRTVSYGFPACCSIEELRERMDTKCFYRHPLSGVVLP